jgi:hypothetical protein
LKISLAAHFKARREKRPIFSLFVAQQASGIENPAKTCDEAKFTGKFYVIDLM